MRHRTHKVGSGMFPGLILALFLFGAGAGLTVDCRAVAQPEGPLSVGKAKMAKGDYRNAVKNLEAAVKESPTSCEAHLCLGQSYAKLKNYLQARSHFRTAIKVGKGSANAQKANTCLMALPKRLLAPRTGPDTRFLATALGLVSRDRAPGEISKPTVLDFYASWCQPCKQLEVYMNKAKTEYGDKVNFLTINVDDPNNEAVVEQYGVSPIPTLVFLNTDGEVVTYSVGYSGETGITSGLKKILSSS